MTTRLANEMTLPPTDNALLAAAQRGDNRAFVELLQTHDRLIRSVVWRVVGDAASLEDVMQDAHLRSFKALPTFDPAGPARISTWLYRIAMSAALDHRRRRSRPIEENTRPLRDDDAHTRHAADPGEQVAWRDALRRGLQRLEAEQAAVIALVDGEGMTQQAAAEVLGTDRDRVARWLAAGRRSLRSYLSSQGVVVR